MVRSGAWGAHGSLSLLRASQGRNFRGAILINITGSFVIGFFGTLTTSGSRFAVPVDVRAFVMVGICGGFTTFSSFSLQTLELARGGRAAQALGNIALSVVLCLLAVAAGHYGAAAIHHRYTGAGVMEANNNATSLLPFSTAFHAPLTLVPPSRRVPFSCVRALSRWSILFAALDFAPLLWRLAWLKPVEPPQRPACLPAEA